MYRVLLVEDDDTICYILKKYKLWETSEFRIEQEVRNGKEAMELLETKSFDLIITDIRMPVVNGLEMLRMIREKEDKTSVILISTYADFQYAKEGMQLGVIDYVEKPISEDTLARALLRAKQSIIEQRELKKLNEDSKFTLSLKEKDMLYQWCIQGEENGLEEIKQLLLKEETKLSQQEYDMVRSILTVLWERFCENFQWISILEKNTFSMKEQGGYKEISKGIKLLCEIGRRYALNKQDYFTKSISIFLASHISEEGLQDKLSEELSLSKDYISKLFKSKMGFPISEYCTRMKMQKAKVLLLESNFKIYEISEELGYHTVDYFSGLFKKYVGCTPMQYKRECQ